MQRKTVVLVCMVDSIHVARWIAQFDPTEVKFILFPSGPNRRVHPKILEMVARGKALDSKLEISLLGGRLSLFLWALDRLFCNRIRGAILANVIKTTRPDFVHALEMQNAGYLASKALEDPSIKTPLIVTNYGSDIFWFANKPKHREKIQSLLRRADWYSAECERDYALASRNGFRGRFVPLTLNTGVPTLPKKGLLATSSTRNIIVVKGYDNWVGRALQVIKAFSRISTELRNFEVVLFSCNLNVLIASKFLKWRYGLKVRAFGKNRLSHAKLLSIFGQARIYVGASESDGVSTSALEAMAWGAFPIQTGTSCASDWFIPDASGFVIEELSAEAIAGLVLKALRNPELVDRAQLINAKIMKERTTKLASGVVSFYER
jgi:glycosyltransferase involved in cell wall biosynthesis